MSKFYIFLFGKFEVLYNDQNISVFNSANIQQLLSYLLLNRRRQHTREALAALFWPEASSAQAKAYLRKALWQLQCAFNEYSVDPDSSVVVAENEWICLNPKSDIQLDVAKFERVLRITEGIPGEAFSEEELAAANEAVQVYRGELLAGWSQEWCLIERERLQLHLIILLDKLTNNCLHNQQYEQGLVYAMRILKQDPAREQTHRALMRLHYLAGDRTTALRQFNTCENILQEELDVRPSTRTQLLYKAICADDIGKIETRTTRPKAPVDEEMLLATLHSLNRLRADLHTMQNCLDQDIETIQGIIYNQPPK